jgi:hypothetical protein
VDRSLVAALPLTTLRPIIKSSADGLASTRRCECLKVGQREPSHSDNGGKSGKVHCTGLGNDWH